MKKGGYEWLQLRAARVQMGKAFDALGRAFIELGQANGSEIHLRQITQQMQELQIMIDQTDAKLNAP